MDRPGSYRSRIGKTSGLRPPSARAAAAAAGACPAVQTTAPCPGSAAGIPTRLPQVQSAMQRPVSRLAGLRIQRAASPPRTQDPSPPRRTTTKVTALRPPGSYAAASRLPSGPRGIFQRKPTSEVPTVSTVPVARVVSAGPRVASPARTVAVPIPHYSPVAAAAVAAAASTPQRRFPPPSRLRRPAAKTECYCMEGTAAAPCTPIPHDSPAAVPPQRRIPPPSRLKRPAAKTENLVAVPVIQEPGSPPKSILIPESVAASEQEPVVALPRTSPVIQMDRRWPQVERGSCYMEGTSAALYTPIPHYSPAAVSPQRRIPPPSRLRRSADKSENLVTVPVLQAPGSPPKSILIPESVAASEQEPVVALPRTSPVVQMDRRWVQVERGRCCMESAAVAPCTQSPRAAAITPCTPSPQAPTPQRRFPPPSRLRRPAAKTECYCMEGTAAALCTPIPHDSPAAVSPQRRIPPPFRLRRPADKSENLVAVPVLQAPGSPPKSILIPESVAASEQEPVVALPRTSPVVQMDRRWVQVEKGRCCMESAAVAPCTPSPRAAAITPCTPSPQAAGAAPCTPSPQAAVAAPCTSSPQGAAAPCTQNPQAIAAPRIFYHFKIPEPFQAPHEIDPVFLNATKALGLDEAKTEEEREAILEYYDKEIRPIRMKYIKERKKWYSQNRFVGRSPRAVAATCTPSPQVVAAAAPCMPSPQAAGAVPCTPSPQAAVAAPCTSSPQTAATAPCTPSPQAAAAATCAPSPEAATAPCTPNPQAIAAPRICYHFKVPEPFQAPHEIDPVFLNATKALGLDEAKTEEEREAILQYYIKEIRPIRMKYVKEREKWYSQNRFAGRGTRAVAAAAAPCTTSPQAVAAAAPCTPGPQAGPYSPVKAPGSPEEAVAIINRVFETAAEALDQQEKEEVDVVAAALRYLHDQRRPVTQRYIAQKWDTLMRRLYGDQYADTLLPQEPPFIPFIPERTSSPTSADLDRRWEALQSLVAEITLIEDEDVPEYYELPFEGEEIFPAKSAARRLAFGEESLSPIIPFDIEADAAFVLGGIIEAVAQEEEAKNAEFVADITPPEFFYFDETRDYLTEMSEDAPQGLPPPLLPVLPKGARALPSPLKPQRIIPSSRRIRFSPTLGSPIDSPPFYPAAYLKKVFGARSPVRITSPFSNPPKETPLQEFIDIDDVEAFLAGTLPIEGEDLKKEDTTWEEEDMFEPREHRKHRKRSKRRRR